MEERFGLGLTLSQDQKKMGQEAEEGESRSCEEARKRSAMQRRPCGAEEHERYRSCSEPERRSQQPMPTSTGEEAITTSIGGEEAPPKKEGVLRILE